MVGVLEMSYRDVAHVLYGIPAGFSFYFGSLAPILLMYMTGSFLLYEFMQFVHKEDWFYKELREFLVGFYLGLSGWMLTWVL